MNIENGGADPNNAIHQGGAGLADGSAVSAAGGAGGLDQQQQQQQQQQHPQHPQQQQPQHLPQQLPQHLPQQHAYSGAHNHNPHNRSVGSENWFSVESALRVYGMYLELD